MVTFASNAGGALSLSNLETNNKIGQINMTEVANAVANANGTDAVEVTVTEVDIHLFF